MSCGDQHDVECGAILGALEAFLDGEDTALDRTMILQHLDECGPCLQEHHIEQLVKARVARACSTEQCSEAVRTRVVTRIRQIVTTDVGTVVTSRTTVTTLD